MTSPSIRTLLNHLHIAHPILQAPMAGISTPAMAAAVCEAGGLGALGLGASDLASAQAALRETRARTTRPFNVNLFVHAAAHRDAQREARWIDRLRPEFAALNAQPPTTLHEIYTPADPSLFALLLAERPAVVSFHFGLPAPAALQALRAAGILTIATVTSPAEARTAVAAGIDAIVAQGWEAGGHRGVFDPAASDDRLGTLALVRALVRQVEVPVIAAGGIMDGAGIDAVLALGAAAAQLGTAYVPTDESAADAGFRAALAGEAAQHTVMTRAISGRPARCLANRFTALGAGVPDAAIPDYPVAYDLGKALNAAGKAQGEAGYGAQWAGQGAPLARAMSAGALTRTLIAEMRSG